MSMLLRVAEHVNTGTQARYVVYAVLILNMQGLKRVVLA